MVTKGLKLATPSLKDVAREAGISYHAARAYSKGQRVPSAEVRQRLASAFRGIAQDLADVADELEGSAKGGQG